MSLNNQFIRLAYDLGYRVTDDGSVVGLRGRPLKPTFRTNNAYPTFTVKVGKEYSKDGYWKLPIHRFAAYCFFGEEMFNYPMVRHLNGNPADFGRVNLALGNAVDNAFDRTPESRRMSSIKSHVVREHYPSLQKLCKISYCNNCGKVFDVTRVPSNRPRKNCSRKCANENRSKFD